MSQYLVITLIFWLCVHFGFSMTQIADHYLFGRGDQQSVVPSYGDGLIQGVTLQRGLNEDQEKYQTSEFSETPVGIGEQLLCQFSLFGGILNLITKLFILDYEIFNKYQEDIADSWFSWLLYGFRLLSFICGIIFTVQLINLAFSSGLFNSVTSTLFVGGAGLLLTGTELLKRIFFDGLC